MFVVERDGDVELVLNGEKQDTPFLTIPDVDSDAPETEGGLLGLAFAPDYATSGRFYVYFSEDDADPSSTPHAPIQLREYQRSTLDPNLANPASGREVLQIPHDARNHYGGTLQFGPDGLLYAGPGDAAVGANAEDTSSRLGKILRLDPRESGPDPYSVPPTNPFANNVGGDELVYAWGLRNPYRFSFDRATGDLTIADVGQNAFEEINFASAASGRGRGAYFGWDTCEGFAAFGSTTDPCDASGDTLPSFAYAHSDPGCNAITGGVVVRDPALPSLAGRYLYAEFCKNYVHAICLPSGTLDTDVGLGAVGSVAAFGETATGGVIVVQLSGQVSRLSGSLNLEACPVPPAEGGGGGGAAAPPPATPAALTFTLGGATRQRPLRSGNVGVRVRCNTACQVRATGLLSVRRKGKRVRLRDGKGRLSSAGSLRLKLRLSKAARRALRRGLRKRKGVTARLNVRVRDSAGRLSVGSRRVRLVKD